MYMFENKKIVNRMISVVNETIDAHRESIEDLENLADKLDAIDDAEDTDPSPFMDSDLRLYLKTMPLFDGICDEHGVFNDNDVEEGFLRWYDKEYLSIEVTDNDDDDSDDGDYEEDNRPEQEDC